jgi:hypothetical protein
MADRIRMYFALLSTEASLSAISAVVGREPSSFAPIGEPIGKHPGAIPRKRSIWRIESGLPDSATIEEHFDALLALLEEHSSGVRESARKFDGCINCYFRMETATPGFHLSREQIARTAALGLPIDFDFYAFPPDDES